MMSHSFEQKEWSRKIGSFKELSVPILDIITIISLMFFMIPAHLDSFSKHQADHWNKAKTLDIFSSISVQVH